MLYFCMLFVWTAKAFASWTTKATTTTTLLTTRRLSSTTCWMGGNIPDFVERHDELFLRPVERTVRRVLQKYDNNNSHDRLDLLPSSEREAVGVARHLNDRLAAFRRDNIHCPRCWLQRAWCICADCPPIVVTDDDDDDDNDNVVDHCSLPLSAGRIVIRRIFLLMHHKEITMTVDTAKMILAAFPETTRLVVGGIGVDMQESMKEMLEALQRPGCLVLFPSDEAQTFQDLWLSSTPRQSDEHEKGSSTGSLFQSIDLVVIDGTWKQARRLYKRYIRSKVDGGPQPVCLTKQALDELQRSIQERDPDSSAFTGRQLRRHPQIWREISTLAATRFLLRDMDVALGNNPQKAWDVLAEYQERADAAARQQLGPIRMQES